MKKVSNKKFFWTCLSFLTFGLFSLAIISKNYWINIFVIIFGLLVNKKGSDILFTKKAKIFNKNNKLERK
jgi:uncharacterized membrane protein